MSPSDRAARTARLTAAAQMRTSEAEANARRAITRLHNTGQPITFTAIAQAAGVSTSFLYQHSQLRTEIRNRRGGNASSSTRSRPASPATIDSLRTKLDAAITRNRHLLEHIEQLTAENHTLRSRLLDTSRTPRSTPDTSAPPGSPTNPKGLS